jgi:hypothetical protein
MGRACSMNCSQETGASYPRSARFSYGHQLTLQLQYAWELSFSNHVWRRPPKGLSTGSALKRPANKLRKSPTETHRVSCNSSPQAEAKQTMQMMRMNCMRVFSWRPRIVVNVGGASRSEALLVHELNLCCESRISWDCYEIDWLIARVAGASDGPNPCTN